MKTNSSLSRLVILMPLLLGAGLGLLQPCAGAPFQFEQTGSLHTARFRQIATLLPNGNVLIAGGDGPLASAELYSQATGRWTATGSLTDARGAATATLLPNGKVLIAGGDGATGDLASGNFTTQRAGPGRRPAALTTHALVTRRR